MPILSRTSADKIHTTRERLVIGALFGFLGLLAYTSLPGALTTFSQVNDKISLQYNVSSVQTSLLNSISFGLTVGMCPFSSYLFMNYGYTVVISSGFAGTILSLVISAYATSWLVLFIAYGICFGIFNNCCYNGLISVAGGWVKGTKWVTPVTVLVSCGISVSVFLFNHLGNWLNKNMETKAVQYRFLALAVFQAIASAIYIVAMVYYKEPPPDAICDERKRPAVSTVQITTKLESDEAIEKLDLVNNTPEQQSNATEVATQEKQTLSETRVASFSYKDLVTDVCLMWLIGTGLWSTVYTMPFTIGKKYITSEFNMTNEVASDVLSYQGIAELVMRLILVAFGTFLPTIRGSYALMFSVACGLISILCIYIATVKYQFAAWVFFISLPFPLGFMNGVVYGGTENIFGSELVEHVWPVTNVLLALGFSMGPAFIELLADKYSYAMGMKVTGYIVLGAAVMFLVLYYRVKRK